jgi:alpha-N-acetylglucosamine transferase
MAYNLALTIKAVENIPIAVIHTGLQHLTEQQKLAFDFQIELPETFMTGFGTKLHLDELTPFDKTLFLDADMLWLGRKPSELFNELSGIGFTSITEGDSDAINYKYYFWADPEEIKSSYKVSKVWQIRSEVLYFEKGTKVFKKARELKPEKKLKTIRKFGEHIPDELYFNIATAILEINPHLPNWMPAYWARLHGENMPALKDLNKDYYLLSFGSNSVSPIMKKTYDNVMQVAAYKLGIPYLFKLKSKKEWAPGRLKI